MGMSERIRLTDIVRQAHPTWASGLVSRQRRYSTPSLTDAQRRLRGMRDEVILSVDHPEDFVGYSEVLLALGKLMLTVGSIDSTSGYDLSFKSGDEYIVAIPLLGSGWVSTGGGTVECGRDDVMIVTPLCRVKKHWDGPGEVVSIHIPAERFDAAAASFGSRLPPFGQVVRVASNHLRSSLRIVAMICNDFQDNDRHSPFMRAPLSRQIEDLLLKVLLEELEADASGNQDVASKSPAVPYYVRRSEQFVAANAHLTIGLDDIAKAAGVSTRTLQYGFRNFHGCTPMVYIKRVRYERARAMLLSGCANPKISDIAAAIGCFNVSQFSRDYRSLFGETPSETIAAMRRLVN